MAGLYVHIPFCKSRCIYCDFYSTTQSDLQKQYVIQLCRELEQRKDYLNSKILDTIYIGGGTPSTIETDDLTLLDNKIKSVFLLSPNCEFTIEANPGDITIEKLQAWQGLGINRLSIGVQTFDDKQLRFLNRRHDSKTAIQAIQNAQRTGFNNISIDLIYGLPHQSIDMLKSDITTAIQLDVQHISTYCLTFEENTPLYKLLQQHIVKQTDDDTLNEMYDLLKSELTAGGFRHYEVSNFCKPRFHSRHNFSYWTGGHYLGIGAAAHSYNGLSRQYNESDLNNYINGTYLTTTETLTAQDKYNEHIMLGLRTEKGISLSQLDETQRNYCLSQAQKYIKQKQ